MFDIKILAVQETNYVNEWLGLLEGHEVTALLIRPNPRLMSIKSYHSYDDSFVRKIYAPYKARGRKVSGVGIFDHIVYTIFAASMLPIALQNDAVIFIGPSYFHTVLIPFLKVFRKKVYVVSIDPQDVLKLSAGNNPIKKLYYRLAIGLECMSIQKADKVFAVSKYLVGEYKKMNKNVFYSPNGADTEYIDKIRPKRLFRQTTIAYFGSFDEWRGVDILVEAFMKLEKRYNIKLALLGGGSQEHRIREMCKNSKNVYISGFISHETAISYCKGSDVLVIPFRENPILYKTAPIKSFEYIACGLPIVVTDTGEHANMIEKLGAGIKTKPDANKMSEAIEKALKNKILYRKIREASFAASKSVDYKLTRQNFRDEIVGR